MTIPEPISLTVEDPGLERRVDALPSCPGIYAVTTPSHEPHLSWSANLRRRLRRLLFPSSSAAGTLLERLRHSLASVDCWPTGSRLEASLLLYEIASRRVPDRYLQLLKLKPPWFVELLRDEFPRLAVLNRVPKSAGLVFGPFPNRDQAMLYEQEVSGLFQLRRCTDILQPAPDHPGCIYGEMNQCLRPCQCAVSPSEYATEVARVSEFLITNGRSSLNLLSSSRDRASADMQFEEAAYIHKRIEKVKAAAATRSQIIAEVSQFSGLALTRAVNPGELLLWPMFDGYWQDPITLSTSALANREKSLDSEIRDRTTLSLAASVKTGSRLEHLAIFSRWYHSSWRDGEWFAFREPLDLNYRKLVREISKLAKGDGLCILN